MFGVDAKMDEKFMDVSRQLTKKWFAHRLALNQKLLLSSFWTVICEVP